MPRNYRIYRLDRANHVAHADWVPADSDEEAIAAARAMTSAGRREVWLGDRLVATIHVADIEEASEGFWL